jgi:hypothetical protein
MSDFADRIWNAGVDAGTMVSHFLGTPCQIKSCFVLHGPLAGSWVIHGNGSNKRIKYKFDLVQDYLSTEGNKHAYKAYYKNKIHDAVEHVFDFLYAVHWDTENAELWKINKENSKLRLAFADAMLQLKSSSCCS